jgi:hypothetical protein
VQALRTVHRYWAALVVLAVVVQIGAAGYGAFNAAVKTDDHKTLNEDQFSNGFDLHDGLGYLIFLGTVVLFLLAAGSRFERRRLIMNLVLPLLLIVQIVLAWGGESTPWVGIFHPIVAFLILGLSGRIVFEAWWGTRRAGAAATP